MKYCGKCGAENIDEDSYCVKCGYSLSKTDGDHIHSGESESLSRESNTPKSNASYLLFGKICCIVALVFNLAILYFWKYNVEITESKTGIFVGTEQMTLLDLVNIQMGSVLSLIVIIMIILAICSVISPQIGIFNSMILLMGVGISGAMFGVCEEGLLIDLVYKLTIDSHAIFGSLVAPALLIMVINAALATVPLYLYRNGRSCSMSDEMLMFWKEPNWYALEKKKI